MNKILKYFSMLFLVAIVFFACTPDQYELQAPMAKSALKFTVTRDAVNPNVFILKSLTPGAQPFWVTPVGTSVKMTDTINIPFPGNDTILYSVETPGGLVTEKYIITPSISTIDAAYVSDPMWTYLSGGLGNSKTWVWDIDANSVSKYFVGPFYFGGTGWEWDPALKDIGWSGVSAGDYGTMTFDLKGNANFTSDNKIFPEFSGKGKFMLYPGSKELITYGPQVLHAKGSNSQVLNWNAKLKIKTLDADHMQLIASTGPGSWQVFNYLSKDYYDSH